MNKNERDADMYYQENLDQQKNAANPSQDKMAIYLAKVMGWMCLGLLTTVASSMFCMVSLPVDRLVRSGSMIFFGIAIAQIVLVLAFTRSLNKMSSLAVVVCFMLYSALTGVTMIFLVRIYSLSSIFFTFVVTSLVFLIMAAYGFITKKDLTKPASLAINALIGIIIGSLVNFFFKNTFIDMIITAVGIIIFIVLIAYDTQKIKGFYNGAISEGAEDENPQLKKMAVFGAFILYLDFINLFLRLLRIFGRKRN